MRKFFTCCGEAKDGSRFQFVIKAGTAPAAKNLLKMTGRVEIQFTSETRTATSEEIHAAKRGGFIVE